MEAKQRQKVENWQSLTWSSSDLNGPMPVKVVVWLPRPITVGVMGQSSIVIYGLAIVCLSTQALRLESIRISSGKSATVWMKNLLP